jgi:TolA-binding protein
MQRQPVAVRQINPRTPAELERIISKSLEKSRELRYQTASDLCADLRRLKRDLDSQDPVLVAPATTERLVVVPAAPRRAGSRARNMAGGAAVGLGTVAAAIIVGQMIRGGRSPRAMAAHPPAVQQAPHVLAAGADALPGPATPPPAAAPAAAAPSVPAAPAIAETRTSQKDRQQWAHQQLAIARSKVELSLHDQAIATLREVMTADGVDAIAVEAGLLMASIQQTQQRGADAMATYLEVAARYPKDARAPEALFRMAQAMGASRRSESWQDARRIYNELVAKYPATEWAARGLLARAEIEERQHLTQHDPALGMSVPSALVTYRQLATTYDRGPHRETALWKMAALYDRVKRHALAAETFVAVARAYPASSADAWFAAAEIYEKRLDDPHRARNAYARVPPTSERYETAQKRLARR